MPVLDFAEKSKRNRSRSFKKIAANFDGEEIPNVLDLASASLYTTFRLSKYPSYTSIIQGMYSKENLQNFFFKV